MRIKTQRPDRIDRWEIHDHAGERRRGDSGGARVHAHATTGSIDWPEIGAFARDLIQLDRITLGSARFSGK
jgi:hypothetical protein